MAKTKNQLEEEITKLAVKIKTLSAKKKDLMDKLEKIRDKEALDLARELVKSGKLEEAKKLIGA